jgi:hypothetical protein
MSGMPSCKDITKQSSDYLEGNQTLFQRLGFKMHIFMCVNCQRYVSQLKLTIATIGKTKNATPQPVDEQHVQEIVEKLHQDADNKD